MARKKEVATEVEPQAPKSIYARMFDYSSLEFTANHKQNLKFLENQQAYFNKLLATRGHVFLNEVYDALGLSRTAAGQVIGWVLGGDASDNAIEFDILDTKDQGFLLIDFNVDGPITDIVFP